MEFASVSSNPIMLGRTNLRIGSTYYRAVLFVLLPPLAALISFCTPAQGKQKATRPEHPVEILTRAQSELKRNAYAAQLHAQAADAWQALRDFDTTKRELMEAIKLDPVNPFYYRFLADVSERLNDLHGALSARKKAVELDGKNPKTRCELARQFELVDDIRSARREYEKCRENVHYATAKAYFPDQESVNRSLDSATAPKQAGKPEDCLAAVRWEEMQAYMDPFGTSEAVKGLREYAESQIHRLGGKGSARIPGSQEYVRRNYVPGGVACGKAPDSPEVVLEWVKEKLASGRNPTWAYWHHRAAEAHYQQEDLYNAMEEVRRAIAADSRYTPAYYYGAFLSSFHDPKIEFEFLTKALELDPQNPKGYFLMGHLMERGAKFESAVDYYKLCLEKLRKVTDKEFYKDPEFFHPYSISGLEVQAAGRIRDLSGVRNK